MKESHLLWYAVSYSFLQCSDFKDSFTLSSISKANGKAHSQYSLNSLPFIFQTFNGANICLLFLQSSQSMLIFHPMSFVSTSSIAFHEGKGWHIFVPFSMSRIDGLPAQLKPIKKGYATIMSAADLSASSGMSRNFL